MISVLIATRNRPQDLIRCLRSILNSSYQQYEVVIVDQSANDFAPEVLELNNLKIKYFHKPGRGKAIALNYAIRRATGNILTFTDDDCIVSKDWLEEINLSFKKDSLSAGVFGATLPYLKTKKKGLVCPATFSKKASFVISNPDIVHYTDLGIGNNMSIKSTILKKIGLFKVWLGSGSIVGCGGIESEIIFRILKNGQKLAFNPKVVVYHNRWLTYHQERILQGKYTSGLAAYYFYYFLKREKVMAKFISYRIKERVFEKLKYIFKKDKHAGIFRLFKSRKEFLYLGWELVCMSRGFAIGTFYHLRGSFNK